MLFDRQPLQVSEREFTDNGFLKVPAYAARTGDQKYLASELGLTDRSPDDIITVYRSEDEVFKQESLDSYIGADITIDHPSDFVGAGNYGELSKGTVTSVVRDGDFVKATLIVKSQDAIDAILSGKVQVSAGYVAEYVEADDNSPYDFEQKNITINHVAIVDRARAGAQARIFDKQMESEKMKITLDNGAVVEVEDSSTATLISESIERLSAKAASVDSLSATNDAQAEKIASLEGKAKQFTDGDFIAKKVSEVLAVKDSAALVAGKEFTCDSTNVMDIKRLALAQVRDSIDWAEKSDEYVNAAFDFATADAEAKKEEKSESMDEDEDEDDKETNDAQIAKLSKDAGIDPVKTIDHDGARKFMSANNWKITTGMVTMAELKQQSKDIYGV